MVIPCSLKPNTAHSVLVKLTLFPFIVCRYGDKTPRSFIGRLFGVLWILLGLIVTTMFIATVTSALQHSSSPEFINALEGMDVSLIMTLKGKT